MNENTNDNIIPWLRQGAAYAASHQGKTFVVSFPVDGSLSKLRRLVRDIALLKILGIKTVLVFSCRKLIDEACETQGPFHEGLRITNADTLKIVLDVSNRARVQIESLLSEGLPDSPPPRRGLTATSGNFVVARPLGIHHGINFEHTGVVRRVNASAIEALLDLGHMVVIPPIGYSPTGELFNLEAKQVAQATATALNADKLIMVSESLNELKTPLAREITCSQLAPELENMPAAAKRTLKACMDAVNAGVPRAHIISSEIDGALLQELFTLDGQGHMVSGDLFEHIRPAELEDISGILDLISPLEEQGVLVARSHEQIELHIEQYRVIERDGTVIGCAALFPLGQSNMAELSCFVVSPNYRASQRGDQLLAHMEQWAAALNISQLCVLTTQTAHWFVEHGFAKSDVETLPEEKKHLYNYQRNSQVFVKPLA